MVSEGARFCGSCGEAFIAVQASRAEFKPKVEAVAILFAGVLMGMVAADYLAATLQDAKGKPEWYYDLLAWGSFLAIGGLASWRLGPGAIRRSLGRRSSWGWSWLGAVLGALTLAFNVACYQILLGLLGGETGLGFGAAVSPFDLLMVAVVPALVEEWLCRGVLWNALERMTGPLSTVVTSAILFGLLHGLNGALVFEFPPRFVAGLVIGWLRLRSGSLWPGIVAHGVNNALALHLVP